MKRFLTSLICMLFATATLSACGATGTGDTNVIPTNPSQPGVPTSSGGADATPSVATTAGSGGKSYPKTGHAPDYSWIAGQVAFTKIQGGCVFIRTTNVQKGPAGMTPIPDEPTSGISAVTVGTAVHSDVSPPLRDITPQVGSATPMPQEIGPSFSPGGTGWDESKVKDGDYVLVFGHVSAADEPREMCPGGTPYTVDSVQVVNP